MEIYIEVEFNLDNFQFSYYYEASMEARVKTFGEKLKFIRKKRGWSQDELSKKANIDGRQISRYENDKVVPSIEILKKLSLASDYFLFEEELDVKKETLSKVSNKFYNLENLSKKDEECLLHILESFEARKKILDVFKDISKK